MKLDWSRIEPAVFLSSAAVVLSLLGFGVVEPVTHFANPPSGAGGTPEAARQAMTITVFHWACTPGASMP